MPKELKVRATGEGRIKEERRMKEEGKMKEEGRMKEGAGDCWSCSGSKHLTLYVHVFCCCYVTITNKRIPMHNFFELNNPVKHLVCQVTLYF